MKALGVEQLWVVNPFKYKESLAATKEALEASGVRVLISQAPCILYEARITGKKRKARFQVTRGAASAGTAWIISAARPCTWSRGKRASCRSTRTCAPAAPFASSGATTSGRWGRGEGRE